MTSTASSYDATLFVWSRPSQLPGCASMVLERVPVLLPLAVEDGPRDPIVAAVLEFTLASGEVHRDLKVRQAPKRDASGDFLPDIDGDTFACDVMHVFTVCRLAVELVRSTVVQEMQWASGWRWSWQQQQHAMDDCSPLRVIAHAQQGFGASYIRSKRAVLFRFDVVGTTKVYSCRAMDIAVHETGHAILDAIKPQLYTASSQAQHSVSHADAVHEAFADTLWIFFSLSRLEWCHEVLCECQFDLRRPCRSNHIGGALDAADVVAVQTGEATTDAASRSFLHQRNAHTCGRGAYGTALVFSAFVWDVIVSLYVELSVAAASHPEFSQAIILYHAAHAVRHVTVRSMCRCAAPTPTFGDWLEAMVSEDILRTSLSACADKTPHGLTTESLRRALLAHAGTRGIAALGVPPRQRRHDMLGDY